MSGLTALVKTAKVARKAEPFYSAVDEAAQALTRGKGTGKEFMTELAKTKGVKPTEIRERGLQKIESMPKMTKEQFLDELEKRPAPQVEEKVLKEPALRDIEDRAHQLAYDDAYDELRAEGMNRHEAEDIAAEEAENNIHRYLDQAAEELAEDSDYAAHSNYTIHGGENYREMLLKMPSFKGEKKLMELEAMRRRVDPEFHSHRYKELTQQIDALKAEKAALPEQFQGVKAHFGGEPGILASIRVSDRVGPKGEKVLHIEEIQSDWHQQGRKKGYKNPQYKELEGEIEKLRVDFEKGLLTEDQAKPMMMELRRQQEALGAQSDVPDAPFKKNWHELAMKRVLNYAAENGYDRVAITPGAEQADRYSLAKHVDRLEYFPESGNLVGVKDGVPVVSETVPRDQLESYVGKDTAKRLLEQEPQQAKRIGETSMHLLEGEDLKLGGEGMKGFYDKMLPDYLNTYGKKYGVQVTPFDIETEPARIERAGVSAYQVPAKTSSLHGFDITPEMRQEITGKGLPLYQQIGIPTGGAAAGMGALEEEDQGFNGGGKAKRLPNTPEARGLAVAVEDDEEPMSSMPDQQPMMPPMEQGYADGGVVTSPVGAQYDTTPDMQDGGQVIQGAAFKEGGETKKRGQVKFASNPDTMWLELMSRS